MSKYIKREDAINSFGREGEYHADTITDMLSDIPSADVVERKRGEWIKDNVVLTSMPPQYQYHCSLCGKTAFTYNNGIQYLSDCCPNCGADMRGAE